MAGFQKQIETENGKLVSGWPFSVG